MLAKCRILNKTLCSEPFSRSGDASQTSRLGRKSYAWKYKFMPFVRLCELIPKELNSGTFVPSRVPSLYWAAPQKVAVKSCTSVQKVIVGLSYDFCRLHLFKASSMPPGRAVTTRTGFAYVCGHGSVPAVDHCLAMCDWVPGEGPSGSARGWASAARGATVFE